MLDSGEILRVSGYVIRSFRLHRAPPGGRILGPRLKKKNYDMQFKVDAIQSKGPTIK